MEKILISACLLGKRVRYDGKSLSVSDRILDDWIAKKRVVSVCPEVDAGMEIPRAPAEILYGDGYDVWGSSAIVMDKKNIEVTCQFKKGAELALTVCQKHNIHIAVLTDNSPSCGSSQIYDGSFTNKKMLGVGVTTALLRSNGIQVFSQQQIQDVLTYLDKRG